MNAATDITRHPDGIFAIDTHYLRPQFDAVHLIVQDGRAALVDTATSHSVPRVLDIVKKIATTAAGKTTRRPAGVTP